MKNYLRITIFALSLFQGVLRAEEPLKFNADGLFKIVQFTDMHFIYNSQESEVVITMMNEVLDIEQPDLVIFTGDIVTATPLKEGWEKVTETLVKRQIPWAVTLGNHDDEHDMKRRNILPFLEEIPYNLSESGESKVYGESNYVLPIQDKKGEKTAALLYCFDSNAYTPIQGVGEYGWFRISQIDWYRRVSTKWTGKNDGNPLPALAFFHIPLPEYNEAWSAKDEQLVGVKNEKVCSPALNSGMFAAMLHQGDVFGTFVGHDHNNDYFAPYCGIALCYGRFSGGENAYSDLKNGARVIVLKEGERQFVSRLRIRGGEKINEVNFETF